MLKSCHYQALPYQLTWQAGQLLLFLLTLLVWAIVLAVATLFSLNTKGAFLRTGRFNQLCRDLWRRFGEWSQHPHKCMIVIIMLAIIPRVLLLPILHVPEPRSHDEFAFILGGETLAMGRITNPPHPLWQFFETEHEVMQPTYMSKYPPVQNVFIALGILLGNKWIGILISYGIMCGFIYWVACAYLPSRWALFAGLVHLVHPGVASYWCNSYFGGAATAIGGALVFGACARLSKRISSVQGCLFVLGLLILANSRPYEGFVAALVPSFAMLYTVFSRQRPKFSQIAKHAFLPILLLLVGVAAMLYYNYRITGNALLMPYSLWQKQYSAVPTWFNMPAIQQPHYNNQQLKDNYTVADYAVYLSAMTLPGYFDSLLNLRLLGIMQFFVGLNLMPMAVASLLSLKDKRMRILWLATAAEVVAISCTAVGFQRHYVAPITAPLCILLVQGFRHLRLIKLRKLPVGITFARIVVMACLLGVVSQFLTLSAQNQRLQDAQDEFPRVEINTKLAAMPGKHLIVVHYAEGHDPRREYVVNGPDIDNQKIVWARDFGEEKDKQLLDYFHDRKVWLFDPDNKPKWRLYTWEESKSADLSKKVDNYAWTHWTN
jgi:hypothetical protein